MDLIRSETIASVEWKNNHRANPCPGVDIWKVSLSSVKELNSFFLQLLSEEETEKSLRYRMEEDKQRYIFSRGALRSLLGKYLRKSPETIEFKAGPNKKPLLKSDRDQELHFNISHSGDFVLIAVSEDAVGVDIEKIDPHFRFREILTGNFSQAEIELIEHAANPRETFYWLWTRKESLLKACSKGLIDNLDAISVLDDRVAFGGSGDMKSDCWDIHSFYIATQYLGSITCKRNTLSINFLETSSLFFLEAI